MFPESIVLLIILLKRLENTFFAPFIIAAGIPSGPGAAPADNMSIHSLTKGGESQTSTRGTMFS